MIATIGAHDIRVQYAPMPAHLIELVHTAPEVMCDDEMEIASVLTHPQYSSRLPILQPIVGDLVGRGATFRLLHETVATQFTYYPSDLVIPVCHEGMNRSQTLVAYLQAVRAKLPEFEFVGRAHGVFGGCDPASHVPGTPITFDTWTNYIHCNIIRDGSDVFRTETAYEQLFGMKKPDRVLEEGCRKLKLELNPDDDFTESGLARTSESRDIAHGLFRRSYYNLDFMRSIIPADGRIVFFCFCNAFTETVKEIHANNPGADFTNVVFVAIPWGDSIRGRDEAEMRVAYKNMFTRFSNCILPLKMD